MFVPDPKKPAKEKKPIKPLKRVALRRAKNYVIPKVSKKRQVENRLYSVMRKMCLEMNPICQVCNLNKSVEIHHTKGRGINLNNTVTWKAICRPCHNKVHDQNIKL